MSPATGISFAEAVELVPVRNKLDVVVYVSACSVACVCAWLLSRSWPGLWALMQACSGVRGQAGTNSREEQRLVARSSETQGQEAFVRKKIREAVA